MRITTRKTKASFRVKDGAALIELAVCLPVFFLITMATIETCRMIYLRQSLAAYETARLAIIPGVERKDLDTMCDVFLRGRKLQGYTLTLSEDPTQTTYRDTITVSITIPAEKCALVGTWFYKEQLFTESVTVMAEY